MPFWHRLVIAGAVFLAVSLLVANVLGIAFQRAALGLVDLVVSLDTLLGNLVFVLRHGAGVAGRNAGNEGDHQQLLLHF